VYYIPVIYFSKNYRDVRPMQFRTTHYNESMTASDELTIIKCAEARGNRTAEHNN